MLYLLTKQNEDLKVEWINVEDRMPDNKRRVMVFDKDGFGVGSGRRFEFYWHFEGERCYGENITHWAELPEAPKAI